MKRFCEDFSPLDESFIESSIKIYGRVFIVFLVVTACHFIKIAVSEVFKVWWTLEKKTSWIWVLSPSIILVLLLMELVYTLIHVISFFRLTGFYVVNPISLLLSMDGALLFAKKYFPRYLRQQADNVRFTSVLMSKAVMLVMPSSIHKISPSLS